MTAEREVIRFFADTGAEHPLWDEGGGLCDLDELPLTAELRADLEAWADEASWPANYLDHPKRFTQLRESGKALCDRTARELGPSFEVRWEWVDA